MWNLGWNTKIHLACGPTDMRKSFNGLWAIVTNRLNLDPLSGQVFVFCNRRANRIKIFYWDGSGLWVCAKRLEKGRFDWPQSGELQSPLRSQELSLLLEGLQWSSTRRKPWYRLEAK